MIYKNSNTYKEIFQQPEMWKRTYDIIGNNKKEISSFLTKYYNDDVTVVFTGAGTSSFVGDIALYIMQRYNISNCRSVATTDITTNAEDIFDRKRKYILVSLARSGNSPESVAAIDLANSICGDNIAHIFITCNAEGELAKNSLSDNILSVVLPEETNDKGLAMTSSFSSMLLSVLLVFDIENFENNITDINLVAEKAESILNEYVNSIKDIAVLDFDRAVFLGTGERKGIAQECHLKLQELTDGRVVCIYDSFLGFRHGPKAVLNDKTIIVYMFSDDEKKFLYESDLVKQINGQIKPVAQIYVANEKKNLDQVKFDLEVVPEKKDLSKYDVVLSVLIGQLMGLFKSLDLGLDVDSPSASGKIARVVEGVTIY